jgi:hypothetical protein
MNIAVKYHDRIDISQFLPQVKWREARNPRSRRWSAQAAVAMSEPR